MKILPVILRLPNAGHPAGLACKQPVHKGQAAPLQPGRLLKLECSARQKNQKTPTCLFEKFSWEIAIRGLPDAEPF